jgi:hypothetical protein
MNYFYSMRPLHERKRPFDMASQIWSLFVDKENAFEPICKGGMKEILNSINASGLIKAFAHLMFGPAHGFSSQSVFLLEPGHLVPACKDSTCAVSIIHR